MNVPGDTYHDIAEWLSEPELILDQLCSDCERTHGYVRRYAPGQDWAYSVDGKLWLTRLAAHKCRRREAAIAALLLANWVRRNRES